MTDVNVVDSSSTVEDQNSDVSRESSTAVVEEQDVKENLILKEFVIQRNNG